jgi:sodium/potassium/calcium exchanger 6
VLTVPIVDFEEEDHRWCRPLNTLHCIFGLLGFAFASQLAAVPVAGGFLTWELLLIVGSVLAVFVWRSTKDDTPPRGHAAFAYIGFAVAIMWISAFANEIVNILETLGRLIGVSDAILGLTVLAWGNSIGDLVADVTVARNGFPRMGAGAAIGGPAMNMLLGIGIACTIKCGKIGGDYKLKAPASLIASGVFLMISLIGSLTIVPYCKFAVGKKYALWLFLVYAGMFISSVSLSLT